MSAPTKSCALDPLNTRHVVKEFLPELSPYITDMCNASLSHGIIPVGQHHAIITPRLKTSGLDPADMKNFWPISNLTFISNIVERLVCRQITTFLERNKLIPKEQSAYARGHSTETAVLKLISDFYSATDKGEVSLLGLLDLSAAFDTVDHSILINRLQNAYGIQGSALSWIRSFIEDCTQSVKFAEGQSVKSLVLCGVPQGSVLEPILFILYTSDVIGIAHRHGIHLHLYTDDSQLHLSFKANKYMANIIRLTTCIQEMKNWIASNHLTLNTDKTQFILLGIWQQLVKITCVSINLDGSDIPLSTQVTCLGVIIDSELTLDMQIRRVSSRCFYYLSQRRTVRRALTIETITTLIHTFIISHVDYCNSVLYGASAVHLHSLQSVLNAADRIIVQKRKFDPITPSIRDELHWLPINQRIECKLSGLIFKCLRWTAPPYLTEQCVLVSADVNRRRLRLSTRNCLCPRVNLSRYGTRGFYTSGPKTWNQLPDNVHDTTMPLTLRSLSSSPANSWKQSCFVKHTIRKHCAHSCWI